MGQKQRKDADKEHPKYSGAIGQSAMENAMGEVMEHSQRMRSPRTGALRMEPHEREARILKNRPRTLPRRGVLRCLPERYRPRCRGTLPYAPFHHYFPGKDSWRPSPDAKPNAVLEALGEQKTRRGVAYCATHRTSRLAGVPTPVGGFRNNPTDYLEWMLERTGMPINDRTRVILGGWLQLVDYFAMHVTCNSTPRSAHRFAPRGSGSKSFDLCLER